jgi:NADH dehydrogenase/NADH:ubiquinone oxidoreductase subunit G
MTIKLTIDGQVVQAVPGQTVMNAAEAAGISIPSLCHHRDLVAVGSCRLCMVEVEGRRGEFAACTLPAADGMIVRTESPEILETRRRILTLLLRDYHDSGHASADPESQFMYWIRRYDIPALPPGQRRYQVNSDPNPFIWVDWNKCVHCNRCVRACEEVQGRSVWGVANRGYHTRIVAGAGTTMM